MRRVIGSVVVSVLLGGFTVAVVGLAAQAVERPTRPSRDTAGSAARQRRDGSPSPFSAEQTCAVQPEGTACWMELTNHPQCYVWNNFLPTDGTLTWTGECSGGLAQGMGTLTWFWVGGSKGREETGLVQDGKRHGRWVWRDDVGNVGEGSYVDGKRHGRWVWHPAHPAIGKVSEGSYVDGKAHGRWVIPYTGGGVMEGSYVDGERHGRWINRKADGSVSERTWVNGLPQRR